MLPWLRDAGGGRLPSHTRREEIGSRSPLSAPARTWLEVATNRQASLLMGAATLQQICTCSPRHPCTPSPFFLQSLSIPDARALLLLGSDAEVQVYAAARGWRVANGRVEFGGAAGGAMEEDKGAGAGSAVVEVYVTCCSDRCDWCTRLARGCRV